jgi:hypothetical protein
MVGSGSGKRRNSLRNRGMNMPAFCLLRWSVNLSEKAFHRTVIPGQTFSSDTNYTFLRG